MRHGGGGGGGVRGARAIADARGAAATAGGAPPAAPPPPSRALPPPSPPRCGDRRHRRFAPPCLALLLLALGACAESGAGAPGGPALPPAEIARRLPAEAADFLRGATTEHEPARPGFGVGVDYATRSRSAAASVQIYDRGQPRIPDDPAAPEIEAELTRSVAEAIEAVRGRPGRRLDEQERTTLALPPGAGPGLRCALLRGALGRMPVEERLCVGGAAGHFLKIQVTAAERSRRPAPPDTAGFLAAIAAAARGLPPPA